MIPEGEEEDKTKRNAKQNPVRVTVKGCTTLSTLTLLQQQLNAPYRDASFPFGGQHTLPVTCRLTGNQIKLLNTTVM